MSIREWQAALVAAGYAPGPVDGAWGARTLAASMAALRDAKPASGAPVASAGASEIVARQPKATRPIEGIVIHCTATPAGRPHTAADIRAWHLAQGWSDVGYHWVVRLDGTIEPGRPEARVGSHVIEANQGTLGVVYVGGCDAYMTPRDTRTEPQKAALLDLCRALIAKYPSIKWIKGHRQFTNAKECPSFDVPSDPLGKLI